MYLGIDFDNGLLNGERMLLDGYQGNYPLVTSGGANDSYSITIEKVYQILAQDFIALTLYQPKKGQSVRVRVPVNTGSGRVDAWAWFQVDSINIQREGSQIIRGIDVLIHVRVTMNLTLMAEVDPDGGYTPPWELPPYNFKIGTELLEQSAWQFYNTTTQQIEPFVNTAGVPLQASITRPLVRMSFSFNLQNIQADWVHQWTGKVNTDRVQICGIWFNQGMVKLESLNFETCQEEAPVAEGETPVTVNYYKCDVSLLIDPQTFERQYLNVGTHIRDANGYLRRLWCAPINGVTLYGTIEDVIGYEGAEEVSENMFLDGTGSGLSPLDTDTGRQVPTYRTGYLEDVCEFGGENGIGLPTDPPFIWNFETSDETSGS